MPPIAPSAVTDLKTTLIPEYVFDAFNHMIAKNWNGRSSSFTQDAVIDKICETQTVDRQHLFINNYLDVEDSYRKLGWFVHYDKPAYNETGEAMFTFKKK